ncbi:sulfate ABC transporter ATP-binding protein [Streptomyces sp. NRRL F-4489]|uniref:ABC transporter ATP-binding protein n=1 Tax=Streptomyces sp. NRRL F-4489 TaxID=1609095 RepID=UPI0007485969|nr:ABC transporter ATP-binding protein [Streptomyces sp. NRRL F-4489]KUL54898.1 sulfate ABC transporter ATP-binding protein [Streptomyces sp. NRRL F-4489]
MEFRGVTRSYGAVRAVDGLTLRIAPGETVALLGRNGAGKSTTLSLLLGLLPPTDGAVRLFGGPPEAAVRAGRVGAMLQDGRPVPRVTVRELVGFVAAAYPRPMAVGEALELAGLGELGGRRIDRLSGGQAQRVRFAVALAGNPELLVLDEPTAALDVEARRAFWDAVRGYARRGNTVLFSTHYLTEADEFADRIVVIDRGRVAADGSGAELRRRAGGALVSLDLAGAPTEPLAGLPGVSAVEIRGDRALLRTADSDATVRALARLDLIRGLQVAPAGLEDAFLALTTPASAPDSGSVHPGAPAVKETV